MDKWPVQDAKARFSELLQKSLKEGPQIVTKRGVDTAVLVPFGEWQHLQRTRRRTLKELLLTDEARGEIPLPPRGRLRLRKPPDLD